LWTMLLTSTGGSLFFSTPVVPSINGHQELWTPLVTHDSINWRGSDSGQNWFFLVLGE
jgi:hypothetical protein